MTKNLQNFWIVMETLVGGKRIIEQPIGDPVPRICRKENIKLYSSN